MSLTVKFVPWKKDRARLPHLDEGAGSLFEIVHCDLAGPINPVSIVNSKYVMVFVNDFSNLIWVYFLKSKYDVCAVTERFFSRHFSICIGKKFNMRL